MQVKKGDIIKANAQKGSFYKSVQGEVIEIKGEFVQIQATRVISRWSDTWKDHPTACGMAVKVGDILEVIEKK